MAYRERINSALTDTANYNCVKDYSFSDEANDEPLSKEEVKNWLRIDGAEDNNIIENLITAARIIVENFINQSLIKRTVTAYINNSLGNIYLPYQPFIELVSIDDLRFDEEIEIEVYKMQGDQFQRLVYPRQDNIKIVYTAGVDDVSKLIHTALLMQVAFMYEHRGDEIEIGRGQLIAITLAPNAKALLMNQRR